MASGILYTPAISINTPAISVNTPGVSVDTPGVSVNTPNSINPIYPATQRPGFSEIGSGFSAPEAFATEDSRLTHLPYTPTLHTYLTHTFEALPYKSSRPYTHLEALHTPRGPTLHTYEALKNPLKGLLGGLLGGL